MSHESPIRLRQEQATPLLQQRTMDEFGDDRCCAHETCSVILSRYNPSHTCSVHAGWSQAPRRTRRRRGTG